MSKFDTNHPSHPVSHNSTASPLSSASGVILTSSLVIDNRTEEPPTIEPPRTATELPYLLWEEATETKQQECGIRKPPSTNQTAVSEDVSETLVGKFPWMALIFTSNTKPNGSMTENRIVCGASLVSASTVLTVAHCVHNQNPHLLKVLVGEHDVAASIFEPINYQDRSVSRIFLRDGFDERSLHNDLAFIRANEDFNFTSQVSPICLPLMNSLYADSSSYNPANCLATGWRKNAFDDKFQPILRKAHLSLVPRDKCQARLVQTKLGKNFRLHSSFICAGGQMSIDTCKGDGGGPLVCASRDNPNKYIQVGVVSWGLECGSDIPEVYGSLEANRE